MIKTIELYWLLVLGIWISMSIPVKNKQTHLSELRDQTGHLFILKDKGCCVCAFFPSHQVIGSI